MIPVILSGGSGTRLWPVSRSKFPKQFNLLFGEPLQNLTLKRVKSLGTPIVVTSEGLRDFTQKKALEAGFANLEILFEPEAKNTAPAVAILTHHLMMTGRGEEIVGIFPADHLVRKPSQFLAALDLAEQVAKENKVVTIGLKPSRPETGYGYIQVVQKPFSHNRQLGAHQVVKFHEKPDVQTAQAFCNKVLFFGTRAFLSFELG